MLEVGIAVGPENQSAEIGHHELRGRVSFGLLFENASSERPMAHRLHHVLADAEQSDAGLAVKNSVQIALFSKFFRDNSISGFFKPSITQRKRFVPSKL